jgi:hypothetical protein
VASTRLVRITLAVSPCWTNPTSPVQDTGAGVSSMNSRELIESLSTGSRQSKTGLHNNT